MLLKRLKFIFYFDIIYTKKKYFFMEVNLMAKENKFQEIMDNAVKLIAGFVKKIQKADFIKKFKKADKRFLILAGVALVLVIFMLALIIGGVKANKKEAETTTTPDSSNITEMTTDAEPVVDVYLNGAGKYRINTGSSPYLNMRLAADKNSSVVTTIPNGTEIEVLFVDDSGVETPDDFGWGYVEYNGKRGWVFMEYLEK